MPIGTYILRKYESKQSDLPASQLLVAGDLTIDTTRGGLYSTYILTKGSAAAITLGAPIAGKPEIGGQDGIQIKFIAGSAQAHVVSVAAGFNGGGAGTVTATTAGLGDSFIAEAYNGNWYVIYNVNVTLST
jgi:hypothetical protein